jgi:hypothetical protein
LWKEVDEVVPEEMMLLVLPEEMRGWMMDHLFLVVDRISHHLWRLWVSLRREM